MPPHPRLGSGWQGLTSPPTTPPVTSFPSKLKPFYSTEENSELVDISIRSVISLQPPGENNESIKVGPSGPPHLLGQDLEVYINMSSAESSHAEPVSGQRQQSAAGSISKCKVMLAAGTDKL